jgi:hypothetical protein
VIIAVVAFVLLIAGGASALVVKHHHDQQVAAKKHRLAEEAAARRAATRQAARDAADAEAQRQADADAAAAQARHALQAKHALERSIRREIIHELAASVTKDARRDVADGLLDGPIKHTDCEPVGGGNVDSLADHTGGWSCLAVTSVHGTLERGYSFSATVNYDTGAYTWQLGK